MLMTVLTKIEAQECVCARRGIEWSDMSGYRGYLIKPELLRKWHFAVMKEMKAKGTLIMHLSPMDNTQRRHVLIHLADYSSLLLGDFKEMIY